MNPSIAFSRVPRRRSTTANRYPREFGFTLIELMVSITILGSIIGVLGLVFSFSLSSTTKIRTTLPGPRAANAVGLYLSSDISSAVPVDPTSWLDTDPKASTGCTRDAERGVNVLRVETRSPADPAVVYVASYRFVEPTGDSTKGSLWRVFCVDGSKPSSNAMVADGIDPNDPPVASVSEGKDSVELVFLVWSRESSPGIVESCRRSRQAGTKLSPADRPVVAPNCPYEVRLSAAIRTVDRLPEVIAGEPVVVAAKSPCQYADASVSALTRSGKDPSLAEAPVSVVVQTNQSSGGLCQSLVARLPGLTDTSCELLRKEGTDYWTGSCFGPETGVLWPETTTPFSLFIFDRVYDGTPKAEPADLPIDVDVPGKGLAVIVRTLVVPGAPTGVNVVPGSRSLAVSWVAPTPTSDTPPITEYVASAVPPTGGPSTCISTSATVCTLTGLTNGVKYSVTVRATNRIGTGAPSSPVIGRPISPFSIQGIVFEDVNYGGGAGRDREVAFAAGGTGRANARVELYEVVNSTANFVASTTTDLVGSYSFESPSCSTCAVRVVGASVSSGRKGASPELAGIPTFLTDSTGTAVAGRTDMVGGTDPAALDAGAASFGAAFDVQTGIYTAGVKGTAQAFALANDIAGSAKGVDFGFNFDTVTNTTDSGAGSLRQVLTNANALVGETDLAQAGRPKATENVVFMVSNGTGGKGGTTGLVGGLRDSKNYFSTKGANGSVATLTPSSALPAIVGALTIDAQAQPNWGGSPIVELRGDLAGSVNGLSLNADGIVLRGLIVNRFARDGIGSAAGNGLTIQGVWSGVDATGSAGAGNGRSGLSLEGNGKSAVIGGVIPAQRNVFSGNALEGLAIAGGSGHRIQGNYIGTDSSGTTALGNGRFGVALYSAVSASTIGGSAPGAGNVISGNAGSGIYLAGTKTVGVQGNVIGLDSTGSVAIRNLRGVEIDGGGDNTIGGSAPGAGNVISGNGVLGTPTEDYAGVYVRSAASGITIAGNTIGLGFDRTGSIPNSKNAVFITGGSTVTVGGSSSSTRNIIAGNASHGVYVNANADASVTVQNNWIGLAVDGVTARGNGSDGVVCYGGVVNNCTIVTNVIANSARYGIWLATGTGHVVKGNYVGTDVTGALARPNGAGGIYINSTAVIGGSTDADRNVVSGNGEFGIRLENANIVSVLGNAVGSTSAGTAALPNKGPGISVMSSRGVSIGGSGTGSANVVTGNAAGGVIVSGQSSGVTIVGNSITANAGLGIDLVSGGDPISGVTANDDEKTAKEPNLLMDTPLFTSASFSGDVLSVEGYVGMGTGKATFANSSVEVFVSDSDPSGYGEGRVALGTLTTKDGGDFVGSLKIPADVAISNDKTKITATATDSAGNTSEFGPNLKVGSSIKGASMWVDASDIDADGNDANEPGENASVLKLTDKSSNNRDFASTPGGQPTLVASPAFSKKVLRFTPSQWMRQTATFPAPSTVIYVARARSAGSSRILQAIYNNWLLGWWGGQEKVAYFEGWNQSTGRSPDLRAHVMSAVIRGTGQPSDFAVDGVLVSSSTAGTTSPRGLSVNAGAYGENTDAEVAEIIVFPRALGADERNSVELGLMDKWGTAVTTLSAKSPVLQAAAAGLPVPFTPQVLVSAQLSGKPISGVVVTFTATSGTVRGVASATVTSDSNGIATAPDWIIQASGCANRLKATSKASSDSVKFTATVGTCGVAYGVGGASMWVDASDTDADGKPGNEPTVDSQVLSLADKSGYARDFESAEANQPTLITSSSFAKNVLRFAPTQWMKQTYDFAAPSTVIYVARARVTGNGRILQGVSNNWLLGWWANLQNVAYHEGWVSYPGVSGNQLPKVVSSVIRGRGQASDMAVNGVVIVSNAGGQTGPNGLAVNTGNVAGGEVTDSEVAEIVVFPRALTSTERISVESALAEKWGLTSTVSLIATTATTQPGSNGVAAAVSPKVKATGFAAAPLPGVKVTFTAGTGGSVGGAASVTVVTDAAGIANAPVWLPGSAACFDRLTVTAENSSDVVKFGVSKGGCPVPYGVSSPAMWVDVSDIDADGNSTNEPAVNTSVLSLTDKSGNNRDLDSTAGKQPTLISSPAFSKNVLRFTPTQWMKQTANFGSPSTVIYVARSRTASSSRILQAVNNNWLLGWWGGQEEVAYMDGWVQVTGVAPTTRARIMSAVVRGNGSTDFAVDGIVSTSNAGGVSGPNGLAINTGNVGGGEVTDSEVAEILVFPRALTNSERVTVESGLAAKWGVTLGQTLTALTTASPTGTPGQLVAESPRVVLQFADGKKNVGATVTFTVTRGTGTVGGAVFASAVTDVNGAASAPGWMLSTSTGYQELTATSSVSKNKVVFTADTGACPAYGVCSVPAMWVDASDTDGDANPANEPSVGSSVVQLADKSGNNRPFASQSGYEPTLVASSAFSKNVLGFTPGQWMRQPYDFGTPSTVIYVARSRAATSGRILSSIGNNWLLGWHGNLEGVAYFQGWVAYPAPVHGNVGRVMTGVIGGGASNSDFYMDGVLKASNTNGTAGPNGLTINNSRENTDAEVAEILVFPRTLADSERAKIEGALAAKWLSLTNPVTTGIVVSLDAKDVASMYTDASGTATVSASGQSVCRWADRSGVSNHAMQAVTAQCPTYGSDIRGGFVNFAANGFLRTSPTLSPDATILVVAQSNTSTWNTWGWLAAARGSNGFIVHPWTGSSTVGFYAVNSVGTYTLLGQNYPSAITNPTLYEMTMGGTNPVNGVFGINGSTTPYSTSGVSRSAGVVPVTLGSDDFGTRYGDGKYREVLIYNRALSAGELASVETYLRTKWATG